MHRPHAAQLTDDFIANLENYLFAAESLRAPPVLGARLTDARQTTTLQFSRIRGEGPFAMAYAAPGLPDPNVESFSTSQGDLDILRVIPRALGARLAQKGDFAFELKAGKVLLSYHFEHEQGQNVWYVDISTPAKGERIVLGTVRLDEETAGKVEEFADSIETTDVRIFNVPLAGSKSTDPTLLADYRKNIGPLVNEFNGYTRGAIAAVRNVDLTGNLNKNMHLIDVYNLDLESLLGKDPDDSMIESVLMQFKKAKEASKKLGKTFFVLASENRSVQKRIGELGLNDLNGLENSRARFQYAIEAGTDPDQVRGGLTTLLEKNVAQELTDRFKGSDDFAVHVLEPQLDPTAREKKIIPIVAFVLSGGVTARLVSPDGISELQVDFLLTVMPLEQIEPGDRRGFLRKHVVNLYKFNPDFKDYSKFAARAVRIDVDAILEFTQKALRAINLSA